jgi:hypothetical protein
LHILQSYVILLVDEEVKQVSKQQGANKMAKQVVAELENTAKQNKRSLENNIKSLEEALNDLKLMLSEDTIGGARASTWTDGYVGRDVAKISALLARQQALMETIEIVKTAE